MLASVMLLLLTKGVAHKELMNMNKIEREKERERVRVERKGPPLIYSCSLSRTDFILL